MSPGVGIHGVRKVTDIYDSSSYQPGRGVGALLSRVKVEMLTALDRELAQDKRLAPLEMSAAQWAFIFTPPSRTKSVISGRTSNGMLVLERTVVRSETGSDFQNRMLRSRRSP